MWFVCTRAERGRLFLPECAAVSGEHHTGAGVPGAGSQGDRNGAVGVGLTGLLGSGRGALYRARHRAFRKSMSLLVHEELSPRGLPYVMR